VCGIAGAFPSVTLTVMVEVVVADKLLASLVPCDARNSCHNPPHREDCPCVIVPTVKFLFASVVNIVSGTVVCAFEPPSADFGLTASSITLDKQYK
jgi:hypothetical protein